VCKALPYWFKRYIFRMNVELEPLYQFDHLATSQKVATETQKSGTISEKTSS
jgi:hypothetical protein